MSDELRQLADDYWQAILDEEPTERHMLGDYSDVASYEEVSREAEERYAATLRDFATGPRRSRRPRSTRRRCSPAG